MKYLIPKERYVVQEVVDDTLLQSTCLGGVPGNGAELVYMVGMLL